MLLRLFPAGVSFGRAGTSLCLGAATSRGMSRRIRVRTGLTVVIRWPQSRLGRRRALCCRRGRIERKVLRSASLRKRKVGVGAGTFVIRLEHAKNNRNVNASRATPCWTMAARAVVVRKATEVGRAVDAIDTRSTPSPQNKSRQLNMSGYRRILRLRLSQLSDSQRSIQTLALGAVP